MTHRLEDMLNDCAVIRTTFETLDLFPAADPIRAEMMEVVDDARATMRVRCAAMRDDTGRIVSYAGPLHRPRIVQALRTLLLTGYSRRGMDACMKTNVFQAVERADAGDDTPDAPCRYRLLLPLSAPAVLSLDADTLIATILDDLLQSIERDACFADKLAFDRGVFQKYIAFMFACYKADNPLFYE